MKLSQVFALCLFTLLISACSLAGDVTPPPGYEQQLPQEPPVAAVTPEPLSGPLYPLAAPDLETGAAIYAEKCIQCHGENGLGDGPQAAQLPNPVAAIGSSEVARQASPASWYSMVTRGNLERFMPGFASLTDAERWDVVAYAFSLSAAPGEDETAAQLYAENCAACHGENGAGDGPEAAGLSAPPASFADPARTTQKTAADHFTAISEGVPPDMPAFEESLSEAERWSLASHLRNMTFHAPGSLAEAEEPSGEEEPPAGENGEEAQPTALAAAENGAGVITGQVINASGGEVPSDLVLMLHGFDNVQAVITSTTDIRPDGSFAFEEIEMPLGRSFVVVAEFGGASYASDIASVQEGASSLELPVTIYETTADLSQVSINRLHLFFEFVDASTVRVIELYILSNNGNKTVVGPGDGEPVIEFQIPEAAAGLEFQDGVLGGRYIATDKGFADTLPIRPGTAHYQVLFAYNLPYERKLEFSQPPPLPVEAVVVLVPEGSIQVRGEGLEDDGVQDMEGAQYHLYSVSRLGAGEALNLTITGRPAGSRPTLSLGTSGGLVIGLAGLGLALVAAGLVLYRRSQTPEAEEGIESAGLDEEELGPENPDSLMDAILALDDLYAAGKLPEEAYLQRRGALKARLKELMNR